MKRYGEGVSKAETGNRCKTKHKCKKENNVQEVNLNFELLSNKGCLKQ